MICQNCNMRWAELPLNFPYEILTKEEELERFEIFNNDKVKCCPNCIEENNYNLDYQKNWLRG